VGTVGEGLGQGRAASIEDVAVQAFSVDTTRQPSELVNVAFERRFSNPERNPYPAWRRPNEHCVLRAGAIVYELVPAAYHNACFCSLAHTCGLRHWADQFHSEGKGVPLARDWESDTELVMLRLTEIEAIQADLREEAKQTIAWTVRDAARSSAWTFGWQSRL